MDIYPSHRVYAVFFSCIFLTHRFFLHYFFPVMLFLLARALIHITGKLSIDWLSKYSWPLRFFAASILFVLVEYRMWFILFRERRLYRIEYFVWYFVWKFFEKMSTFNNDYNVVAVWILIVHSYLVIDLKRQDNWSANDLSIVLRWMKINIHSTIF